MVNAGDIFICMVAGLAIPLALLDGYRGVAGVGLRERISGSDFHQGPIAWLLTMLLGPGLFIDRMLAAWRLGDLSLADGINGLVIAFGWAGLYGFVVLGLARTVLPI